MPNVNVYDMSGKVVGDIALSDAVFGIEPNSVVMHAAVVNYLANQRQGTQSTLTRTCLLYTSCFAKIRRLPTV